MSDILVSVIIPTYNRCRFLQQALNCCKSQTLTDIEFVFVDDGSMDGSYTYLKEQIASDPRFILKRTRANKGPYYCRNMGLAIAQGKYVGFFDSDDIIPPDYFKKLYLCAAKSDADIVYTCYNNHTHTLKALNTLADKFNELRNGALWDKLYKLSFLKQHHLHFEEGLYTADNIFIIKSFYYAKKIALINEPKYQWIKRNDSIGQDISKQTKRQHDILKVLHEIIRFAQHQKLSSLDLTALKFFCIRSLKSYKNNPAFLHHFEQILNTQKNFWGKKAILSLARLVHVIDRNEYKEQCQILLIKSSCLFDKEWYLTHNPDIVHKKISPEIHYYKHGWREARNPGPQFDGQDYLSRYQDVALSGMNPLVHYLMYGAKEGRTYTPVQES